MSDSTAETDRKSTRGGDEGADAGAGETSGTDATAIDVRPSPTLTPAGDVELTVRRRE